VTGISVHVSVVASEEYTNIVKPVVVRVIALDSQRAVAPAPESMFVITVGMAGNVKPKLTTAVAELWVVNVNDTDPSLVQLVKLVMFVWFVVILACKAAISDA
jgi:hypothetical protein